MYGGRDHVTASPRPPLPGDPVQRDDPEALIEEARQRARRRRRLYGAAAALLALLGVVLFASFGRPEPSQSAAGDPAALPVASDADEATVVAHFAKFPFGWVFVYDDGRVLWHDYGESPPGPVGGNHNYVPLERRLTADGLDLVRSGALPARDFIRALSPDPNHPNWYRFHPNWDADHPNWTDVSLPAGLWADPEFKPYVPSRYAACPGAPGATPRTLEGLPAPTQALLRGTERTYRTIDVYGPTPDSLECFVVSAAEASVLERTLADARFLGVFSILPHGEPAWLDAG
jgi:hypothetical protein